METDLKIGQTFKFIEHTLRIIKIQEQDDFNYIFLKCAPNCCSKFKVKMKISELDFFSMIENKILKKTNGKDECLI